MGCRVRRYMSMYSVTDRRSSGLNKPGYWQISIACLRTFMSSRRFPHASPVSDAVVAPAGRSARVVMRVVLNLNSVVTTSAHRTPIASEAAFTAMASSRRRKGAWVSPIWWR